MKLLRLLALLCAASIVGSNAQGTDRPDITMLYGYKKTCIAGGNTQGYGLALMNSDVSIDSFETKFEYKDKDGRDIQSSFNCDFENQYDNYCSYKWISQQSELEKSIDLLAIAPVLDERWSNFKILHTNGKTNPTHSHPYNNPYDITKKFYVSISLRSNQDAQILLCSSKNPKSSSCYWIIIDGFSNKDMTAIRKCVEGIPDTYPQEGNCRTLRQNITIPEKLLHPSKWTHLILSRVKNNNIRLWSWDADNGERELLNFIDNDNGGPLSLSYMFVRSYMTAADWKIHSYKYFAIRKQLSEQILLGPVLNFSTTICVSFYVLLCRKCKMDILLEKEDGDEIMRTTIEGDDSKFFMSWENIRLESSKTTTPQLSFRLYVTLSTTDQSYKNVYWAFDDFRQCAPEEIRVASTTASNDVLCHSLKYPNWTFKPKMKFTTSDSPICTDVGYFGQFCNISCNIINTNGCTDHKICLPVLEKTNDGACTCAAGNKWGRDSCIYRCDYGYYGYNCEQVCGKCKHGTCDAITGKCSNDDCESGYIPPSCQETFPRFVSPPEVIQVSNAGITVKFVNTTIQGPENMVHHIILQCKIEKYEWYNCSEPITNLQPELEITITNLKQETVYYIRAVIYTEDGAAYMREDLPYTYATTYCETSRQIYINAKARSANISFETSNENCYLNRYTLKLIQDNHEIKVYAVIQQNMVLQNLKPFKKYEIQLTHRQYPKYLQEQQFETEQDAPSEVRDIKISKKSSNDVFLSWNKPEEENGIIKKYIVTYQLVQRIQCRKRMDAAIQTVMVDIPKVHIPDLEPYSLYNITIAAKTIIQGKDKRIQFETLMEDVISDDELPEYINITEAINKQIIVSWKILNCIQQKGPLYFNIVMNCVGDEWCDEVQSKTLIASNENGSVSTNELTPFTTYIAELRAKRTSDGLLSTVSRTAQFTTLPGEPPAVRSLTAYSKDKNSISIRWLNPYPPHGNLENFFLKYCYVYGCWTMETLTSKSFSPCDLWDEQFNCFIIQNLYSAYDYSIMIRAKNKEFRILGIENSISTRTQEERSQAPLNLSHQWENNIINLFWNHPNITNGRIRKFLIVLKQNGTEIININEKGYYEYTFDVTRERKTYNYTIEKTYRYSSSYILTICGVNSLKGEKATLSIDTPPETPELDSNVIVNDEKITNTSVSVTIPGAKKNTKSKISFLYVAVSTANKNMAKRETQNENTFKEDILKFSKYQNKWIAVEKELREEQISIEIGDDSRMFSKSLNEEIHNRKLEPSTEYEITVVAINQYRQQRSTKNYSLFVTTAATEVASSALYALLLLLLLPIVGFFIYRYVFKNETGRTSMVMSRLRAVGSVARQTMSKTISEDQHEPDVIPLTEAANEPSKTKPKKPQTAPKPGSSSKLPENVVLTTKENVMTEKGNPTEGNFFHSRRVLLENLEYYLKEVLENGELEQQHALFPRGQTKPWDYGMLKPNKFKNRYNNLVAYDHNRVKLAKLSTDTYSDYINANYVHGYRQDKAYIATQGPKLTTINDFWRMIWQEKTQYIIMLANVVEAGKKKCEKYWPDIESSRQYGNVEVYFEKSELYADFEYRTFQLTCKEEKRKVYQLHFTSWPDHGVPIYPQSLVPFLKKILTIPQSTAPIVVHCSAGVGRTGTIILCDICLRMAAREKAIDVLRYLHEIREQRANMVDNIDQYKLVHMVLLECLLAPDTNIPCNADLSTSIQKLIEEGGLQIQLNYLQQSAWQDKALNFSSPKKPNPANETKNRFNDILPLENQIYISRYPVDDENSDYINAVPVDGFRFKEQFIVTQLPMPNTVKDFWRMVAEKSVKVIVSLNDIPKNDQTCCNFWPVENEELKPVPNIILKYQKLQQTDFYDVYSIILDNKTTKETTVVQIVQFKNWKHGKKLPANEENLVMLWEETENLCLGNYPMVVTCYDGSTACGLFVAMSFIIEKIKLEQQCDPCLAVRVIRRNRKQFVSNKVQFEFLYRSAVIYLSMFETYSNFQPVVHKNI